MYHFKPESSSSDHWKLYSMNRSPFSRDLVKCSTVHYQSPLSQVLRGLGPRLLDTGWEVAGGNCRSPAQSINPQSEEKINKFINMIYVDDQQSVPK
jgi:hypothetical protein